jgi:SAM-dependent methyltransferase
MASEYGPGFHARADTAVDLDAYDAYLGRWSRLFVTSVLRAAHVSIGHRILDVATGPGEAALLALPVTAPHGRVVGVDIAEPMLGAARRRLDNSAFCCVVADAEALPFGNSCFDAVVCQLGLQFLPDPARGLKEMRRVLRSGQHVAVCVISTPERANVWGALADALSRQLPAQRDTLHLSFSLANAEQLKDLLLGAGFSDVAVERQQRQDTLESFAAYWRTVENGVGMLPQAYRALPPVKQREVRNEVQAELAKYVSDTQLELSLEMLIGAGRA